jgi:hypothetical protein
MATTAVATKPVTQPAGAVSRLAAVKRGRLIAPLRYFFYGAEGVGKSTLAAHAPDPIWLDIEDGSGQLDVPRYQFRDGDGGHVPHSYEEILSAIDDLTRNPHSFQTVVFDTADRLEALLWQWMIARDTTARKPLDSIEAYGYGKGPIRALDDWRGLCFRLDRLRTARKMSIIILGHAQIRLFKSPDSEDYDRYNPRINALAAGFLKEWSDVTGFAMFEEFGSKLGDDRAKGTSTGRRLLKLERTAAFDAKSRIALPKEVELDPANPWAPFAAAVNDGVNMDPAEIATLIDAETTRIGSPELTAKAQAFTKEALAKNDTATLHRSLLKLRDMKPATTTP